MKPREFKKILEKEGFVFTRQSGSHVMQFSNIRSRNSEWFCQYIQKKFRKELFTQF